MPHTHLKTIQRSSTGFSLLELTIVISIIALALSTGLMMSVNNIETSQVQKTEAKIAKIEKALLAFAKANTRLPCPADITLSVDTANFGIEGAIPGTCTGETPAANNESGYVVAGAVPTKTLNLPDELMLDEFGNRIIYHVDKQMTAANAFTTYPIANTAVGAITINDAVGTARTTQAVYALVSHGQNGHGAYAKSGARINNGSTNTDELENCDCTNTAMAGTFNTTLVLKNLSTDSTNLNNNFDDLVSYKVRSQIEHKVEQLTSGSNGGGGSDGGNTSCTAEKTVFSYTGAVQTYTVPEGCDSITVKVWGAGGGGGYHSGNKQGSGGGGGYAVAMVDTSSMSSLQIVVGGGGTGAGSNSNGTGGHGGGGSGISASGSHGGGGGGGYSGVFNASVSHANALVIAGGGGGGGSNGSDADGGAGGGTTGVQGGPSSAGGGGGTQSAGGTGAAGNTSGTNGSTLQGGNGGHGDYRGGGAGGGYYGGGGGAAINNGANRTGGGGGSGYCDSSTTSDCTLTAGSGTTPGNDSDSDRSGLGDGGAGRTTGDHGLVVIIPGGSSGSDENSNNNACTIPDANWSDVTLRMDFDNDFTDSSDFSHTVTANGNAAIQNTYKKYGASAAYFDGSGDRLSVANSTGLDFGTGDFTIETWVYLEDNASIIQLIDRRAHASTVEGWVVNIQAGVLYFYANGLGWPAMSGGNVPLKKWAHIAITREGSTFRQFVNGVETTTATSSASLQTITGPMYIGNGYDNKGLTGYIDDVRITKGVARYTANFTPDPGTFGKCAICSLDSNWNNVSLLMNFDTSIEDLSANNYGVAIKGDSSLNSSIKKFGAGAVYFDGNGDYLSVADSNDLDFGNSDFTIEAWFNASSLTEGSIVNKWDNQNGAERSYYLGMWSSNLTFHHSVDGINVKTLDYALSNLSTDTWYHVAVVRNSNTITMYVNGTSVATSSESGTIVNNNDPLYIGISHNGSTFSLPFNGYIDDLRITKGTARYTADFTVPTQSPKICSSYKGTSQWNSGGGGGATTTTWNPHDKGSNVLLSSNNTRFTTSSTSWNGTMARSTDGHNSGKRYFEFTWTNAGGTYPYVGIASGENIHSNYPYTSGLPASSVSNIWTQNIISNTDLGTTYTNTSETTGFTTNDIIMVAVDMDTDKIYYGKNGSWSTATGSPESGSGVSIPTGGHIWYSVAGSYTSGHAGTFQQSPTYPIPNGYTYWGTK